jgi:hypothetical protein
MNAYGFGYALWAFEIENYLPAPKFINCSHISIRTVRPLTQKRVLAVVFI